MSTDKKQGVFKIGIIAIKVVLCICLVFNAIVFIYYGFINKGEVVKSDPVRYMENWKIEYAENGDQTAINDLPQNVKDNEYIYFNTRNDVSVFINGELRKDFIEERDINLPGGSFKRFLMSVPLTEDDAGAQIMIVRKAPQDIDYEMPEVFISTRFGALGNLLKDGGLAFVLSAIVLIFAFSAFVVSIILSILYKQRIDMLYGSLGIFTISAWLITDSYLYPFVFGVDHVNGLLSFIYCLVIPLPLILFLSSIQRGRYRTGMFVVMVISFLNATVWPFLHFTGIVPFEYMRDLANDVLVILSVAGIAILIFDAVKGNISEYRYTFIGFLCFLFGCLIELMITLLDIDEIRTSVAMVTGLGLLLIFIVIQQVNDLRKINIEKKHAIDISEAKTRFLASMSHEIRTPINSILGMNEMILRENNDKAIDEYSRNIKTSGKMLLSLINDVLDFTKIESGKLEIRESDFLLSDTLYDVISLIKERADEKGLNLSTEIVAEIPNELVSDDVRIRQILINLLNNAVKYTDEGNVILKVGGTYTDDGFDLRLIVKDTGKGIREEDQGLLFDAFSRVDLKSNINIEGTGLGLAIVKSIVDSMNGEIGVESEYGAGSEFWVKLPVRYKSKELLRDDFMENKVEIQRDEKSGSFIAPDARILAVDDNQSNLNIVKLFLKRNAISPDLCNSGTKAIMLCKEKKYDLILMDHMMPEPDGVETLHIIKSDEASLNKDTTAIVLTANAVAGSRQLYIDEGFDDYLSKPLDSKLLEKMVMTMLPEEKVIISSQDTSEGPDIEGLDYETALTYCGGEEELFLEIAGDISKECQERVERMRKSLETKDIDSYRIDAHSIKNSMATVGLVEFSERAKKHEFAAKEDNIDFIYSDAEAFINKYIELCEQLGALG